MTRDFSDATTHPDKVRPSSAVSRWSMDSSDVSSGVISDSWGGNNGTLNGGVTTGASGIGGSEAFSFDGTDDYVDCGSGIINYDSGFSVSFWIRNPSFNNHVIDERTGGYSGFAFKTVNNSNIQFTVSDGSNGATAVSSTDVSTGWYHVVGVWSEGESKSAIYINGSKEDFLSNTSIGDSSASDNFFIGAKSGGSGTPSDYISMDLDEVRVYSEALSQQQVWKLYNVGRNANWGFSRS